MESTANNIKERHKPPVAPESTGQQILIIEGQELKAEEYDTLAKDAEYRAAMADYQVRCLNELNTKLDEKISEAEKDPNATQGQSDKQAYSDLKAEIAQLKETAQANQQSAQKSMEEYRSAAENKRAADVNNQSNAADQSANDSASATEAATPPPTPLSTTPDTQTEKSTANASELKAEQAGAATNVENAEGLGANHGSDLEAGVAGDTVEAGGDAVDEAGKVLGG